MAEVDLKDLTGFDADDFSGRDAETGISYRESGVSPWWNNQLSQAFQVKRAVSPVKDFRVYVDSTDGALECSITAGKVWFAGAVHTYAGAVNITLTASNTNYIYFDPTDDSIGISVSAFPDPLDTPHV